MRVQRCHAKCLRCVIDLCSVPTCAKQARKQITSRRNEPKPQNAGVRAPSCHTVCPICLLCVQYTHPCKQETKTYSKTGWKQDPLLFGARTSRRASPHATTSVPEGSYQQYVPSHAQHASRNATPQPPPPPKPLFPSVSGSARCFRSEMTSAMMCSGD